MPGAAVTMIALSEEMGADGRVVTLLQYMRVVLIILVIPWVASWLAPDTAALLPPPPAEAAPASPAALALGMVAVAGTCLAGSALAARLRFPAPTLAGPLVAAMVVNSLLPYDLYLPSWLAWIALAVKGARIGGQFDRPALARVRAAIPAALGQTGVLILACAGVGYAVHRLYRIDPLTALLATAPGALEAITATAYVLNADLALVTAIHLLRVLTMALVAPWCLRWLQPRIRASASPSSLRTTATSSRSARS
jgi:membrane AbrB-like protein